MMPLSGAQNKKGEAPQQSKKEESKKNKRARYAAENQKTVLERQQVRAGKGTATSVQSLYCPRPPHNAFAALANNLGTMFVKTRF